MRRKDFNQECHALTRHVHLRDVKTGLRAPFAGRRLHAVLPRGIAEDVGWRTTARQHYRIEYIDILAAGISVIRAYNGSKGARLALGMLPWPCRGEGAYMRCLRRFAGGGT